MNVVWHPAPTTYREHVTDDSPCWCRPDRICAYCNATTPCPHGTDRPEVVVHREAS